MADELEHFFQCVEAPEGWEFQVAIVEWPEPHTPSLQWRTLRRWKTSPQAARLQRAKAGALRNPRFFRTCQRCGELNNAGHMHSRDICQGCAERDLGVIH